MSSHPTSAIENWGGTISQALIGHKDQHAIVHEAPHAPKTRGRRGICTCRQARCSRHPSCRNRTTHLKRIRCRDHQRVAAPSSCCPLQHHCRSGPDDPTRAATITDLSGLNKDPSYQALILSSHRGLGLQHGPEARTGSSEGNCATKTTSSQGCASLCSRWQQASRLSGSSSAPTLAGHTQGSCKRTVT